MKRFLSIFICFIIPSLLFGQNFNIESKLKQHVEYLTSDSLEGRKAGSEGERAAAEYIFKQMSAAGVMMLSDENGQEFTIEKGDKSIHSCNVAGVVEGYDPSLRDEFIVVGAHYDALGTNTLTIDGESRQQIYYGADDNASGVAILLELAEMVSENAYLFPRSIVFVAFGASEDGNAGSWFFVNRSFKEDIGNVKAMIDLNMLGRGDSYNPFQLFSQVSREALADIMNQTLLLPVVKEPVIASGTITPSDYLPFYDKDIPVMMFTTGMTKEYHSIKDVPALLEYNNMEVSANYIFYFLENISMQKDDLSLQGDVSGKSRSDDDTIYDLTDCDVKPQFFHADESHFLKTWVYKYLKYPKIAVSNGVKGKVYVSFVIEKDGKVSNVEVVEGVSDELDEEAVKVVSISPKWIPGQIRGRKVRTRIVLPIEFRLRK